MNEFTAVVLAAGMGTRMKSGIPKVLHKICGKELCVWAIDAAKEAGANKIITVVGHGADAVREVLAGKCEFAVQKEQKGTGHACMKAAELITEKYTVILSADAPLVTANMLKNAVEAHKASGYAATVITASLKDPTGYGRIVRDENGYVLKCVEQKDAGSDELQISEVNSGMYVFDSEKLKKALLKIKPNNAQGEYYLTDTLSILRDENETIGAFILSDSDEMRGINDRVQLAEAEQIMRKRINEYHMKNGVTIRIPETVMIEENVEIDIDTEIQQNVILKSGTKIGKGCFIGMGTTIENTVIGDNVSVLSSNITNSSIGNNTTVGPFAYIRPNCNVGENARIGDFVELKNCNVGNETKVSHLTYVGDADVGEKCNFGCGTVTVNYDGKKKYRTVIGNNVFVGCNSNLVAPVKLGDGSYTAAGSTITDEVPEDTLAIARARQINKNKWNDRRK